MRKLLLAISILFITTRAYADIHTFNNVAGNWSDGTKWDMGATPAAGDDVVFNAASATCAVDGATNALKSLDMTGYAAALSGTANITIRGVTASTNVCKIVGIGTWTGTLIFSPISSTAVIQLTSNANALTKMTVTSGAAVSLVVLQDDLNFTAVKTNSITLTTQALDLNGHVIKGNSTINRVLITSVTLGTSVDITVSTAGSSFTNADFRDIHFANGGANYDISDIAGGSGDCGGNDMSGGGTLSLTVTDDWYWHNPDATTPKNFSNNTMWFTATNGGGTRMDADPRETGNCKALLPQDNCFFDVNSMTHGAITVDQDLPRMCTTLDFTGVAAMTFHVNNVAQTIYGSLTLASNVSTTVSSASTFTFEGRGAYTYTSAGKTINSINSVIIAMINGSLTQQDNCSYTEYSGGYLTLSNGTFDANDYTVNVGYFVSNGVLSRKLLMGNNYWYIKAKWDMSTTTNLDITWSAEGSTINFLYTSVDEFRGGGLTYNNILFNASSSSNTLTGSNTFNTFTINAPKTVKFTAGTTTKIKKLIANGQASKRIAITSATSSPFTLIDTDGGENTITHCNISWCNAMPAFQTPWIARSSEGNIDRGGNKGIIFNPGEVWIRLKAVTVGAFVMPIQFWHNTLND